MSNSPWFTGRSTNMFGFDWAELRKASVLLGERAVHQIRPRRCGGQEAQLSLRAEPQEVTRRSAHTLEPLVLAARQLPQVLLAPADRAQPGDCGARAAWGLRSARSLGTADRAQLGHCGARAAWGLWSARRSVFPAQLGDSRTAPEHACAPPLHLLSPVCTWSVWIPRTAPPRRHLVLVHRPISAATSSSRTAPRPVFRAPPPARCFP